MILIRRLLFWFMIVFAVTLATITLSPSLRSEILGLVERPYSREVLATAEGQVLNDGKVYKVIKFRGPTSIFIEVVEPKDETKLLARVVIPDRRDGLFNLKGRVTRLAIDDIDEDGKYELLVPTFDDQLVPHLNVYRYDNDSKEFIALKGT